MWGRWNMKPLCYPAGRAAYSGCAGQFCTRFRGVRPIVREGAWKHPAAGATAAERFSEQLLRGRRDRRVGGPAAPHKSSRYAPTGRLGAAGTPARSIAIKCALS